MRFHITLKDNETGETHIDEDIDGILLAASTKESNRGWVITRCNAFELAGIYNAAQEQLEKIGSEHPEIVRLAATAGIYWCTGLSLRLSSPTLKTSPR